MRQLLENVMAAQRRDRQRKGSANSPNGYRRLFQFL